MAERKITVAVDEDLVEAAQTLGTESLSRIVNDALAEEIDRRARAAALARQLAEWDRDLGPVDEAYARAAAAAFDDLDAVAPGPASPSSTPDSPAAGIAAAGAA